MAHDIFRLDVGVDEALAVEEAQGGEELCRDRPDGRDRTEHIVVPVGARLEGTVHAGPSGISGMYVHPIRKARSAADPFFQATLMGKGKMVMGYELWVMG